MQQITLEEVMHWFDQHLSGGKNFRKLGLQVSINGDNNIKISNTKVGIS